MLGRERQNDVNKVYILHVLRYTVRFRKIDNLDLDQVFKIVQNIQCNPKSNVFCLVRKQKVKPFCFFFVYIKILKVHLTIICQLRQLCFSSN